MLGALALLSNFLCSCAKIEAKLEGASSLLEDSVFLKCGLHGMGNIGFIEDPVSPKCGLHGTGNIGFTEDPVSLKCGLHGTGNIGFTEDPVSPKCGLHGMGNMGFTIFARLLFSLRGQYLTEV